MSDIRRGMILAAGLGMRLRPLTASTPKALLPLAGRPMIEYPLRMLATAGVREIVVNLHHLGEQIRERLGDGERFGVTIRYSAEDPLLDTGGALVHARRWLEGAPFFLINCDALLDVDLAALAAFHREGGTVATLVVREDPAADRYGAIDVDASGRVRRFLGEPAGATGEPTRRTMFTGLHVLEAGIFDLLPGGGIFSITRDVYARACRGGVPLRGFLHADYWKDLGTPESLAAAEDDILSGRFAPRFLAKRA